MQVKVSGRKLCSALAVCVLSAAPQAQQPPAAPQPPASTSSEQTVQRGDTIRRSVDLVTTDVIVRDSRGQFDPNLVKKDFDVYEDGVKQQLVTFVLTHGGRVLNSDVATAPPPIQEGILLPPQKPAADASGRIFLIFVDDLHMDFRNTGRIRDLFKKIQKELIHEGDMFGIVSSGPSSIAVDMTYDKKRLDEAINKIAGNGLKPSDIIDTPSGSQGPPEVRYRAHVAFSTVNDILKNLEQVRNRRKAFIWVSEGYDFDPYRVSRDKADQERYSIANQNNNSDGSGSNSSDSGTDPFSVDKSNNEFAAADLAAELAEVTREANRANATLYTIDPRGLVGQPDLDEDKVDATDWQDHVRETQTSLRVLAEQTGGTAVVNQNDFEKALKRIDAETSDYYVLGYYSSNPDPTKRTRKIEVKVTKPGQYDVRYRSSYTLRPRPANAAK